MNYTAYIGIGSNLGDRLQNCTEALQLLQEHGKIEVVKVSGWYESLAEDTQGSVVEGQPSYVNGAAKLSTELSPEALLEALLEAESELGREPKRKKGYPRTVDLDLLLYGDEVRKSERLTIPHPLLDKRLFVLKPLYDIAPEAIEPVNGKTVADLMNACLSKGTANNPTRLDEPLDYEEGE
jgi:2-amino-4-hydroxy-6-hydroxymethyldihydropteridine diphosphokinase